MTGAYKKVLAMKKSWSPSRSPPHALAPEWAPVTKPLLGVPSVQLISEPWDGSGTTVQPFVPFSRLSDHGGVGAFNVWNV